MDFFGCTIDELVGRSGKLLEQMNRYDNSRARMTEAAGDLLKCNEHARQKGFLALEGLARRLSETRPDKGGFLVFADTGAFEIQVILRNLDNDCFTKAMCGASGRIVVRFLENLSDAVLRPVSADIDNMECTEEEMVQAQSRVLEVGAFAVNYE